MNNISLKMDIFVTVFVILSTYIVLTLSVLDTSKARLPSETDIYSRLEQNDDSMTVIGTADGVIHGLDRDGITKKWSLSTGGSLLKSHQNEIENNDYNIIPALDGSILVHNKEGMRKTSVKARMLVEKTPFVAPDGVIFTGQKKSRLLGVDMSSGRVMHDSEGEMVQDVNSLVNSDMQGDDETDETDVVPVSPMWLGRVDYTVRAFDGETGQEKFNMTYSEIIPLSSANAFHRLHHHSPTNPLRLPSGSGEKGSGGGSVGKYVDTPTPLLSTPDGEVFFTDSKGRMHHSFDLSSPAVFAFNVQDDNAKSVRASAKSDYVIQPLSIHYRMSLQPGPPKPSGSSSTLPSTQTDSAADSPDHTVGNSEDTVGSVAVVRSLVDGGLYAVIVPPQQQHQHPHQHSGDTSEGTPGLGLVPIPVPDHIQMQSLHEKLAHGKGTHPMALAIHGLATQRHSPLIDIHGGHSYSTHSSIPVSSPLFPGSHGSHHVNSHTAGSIIPPTTHTPTPTPATIASDESAVVDNEELSVEIDTAVLGVGVHKLLHSDLSVGSHSPSQAVVTAGGGRLGRNQNQNQLDDRQVTGEATGSVNPLQEIEKEIALEKEARNQRTKPTKPSINTGSPYGSQSYLTVLTTRLNAQILYIEALLIRLFVMMGLLVVGLLVARQYGIKVPLPTLILAPLHYALGSSVLRLLGLEYVTSGPMSQSNNPFADEKPLHSSSNKDSSALTSSSTSTGTGATTAPDSTTSPRLGVGSGLTTQVVSFTTADGQQKLQVGSLELSLSMVLGYGSHGTVVFRGSLNGRPVAVKRMLLQFHRSAEREISLLIRSDGHPNVVRYFLREQYGEFVYLALQLCKMSLRDFVVRLQHNLATKRLRQSSALGLAPRAITVFGRDGILASPAAHSQHPDLNPEDLPDEVRKGLLQIAEGVAHLHSQRIVHRDLKPHNILLASPDMEASTEVSSAGEDLDISALKELSKFVLKISDMGLGKQLDTADGGSSSFAPGRPVGGGGEGCSGHSASTDKGAGSGAVGTVGWQAPELLMLGRSSEFPINTAMLSALDQEASDEDSASFAVTPATPSAKQRTMQTVDIFSLGCVFYYTLIPGSHPFGEWYEREANIMTARPDLRPLKGVSDALDLITRMIEHNPEKRPTASQVCHHPFFWTAQKRLEFLVDFSDRLEHELPDSPLVLAVESGAAHVVGRSWDRKLHRELLEDIGRYRKYDSASVRDCLRLIRNKRHHFNELPGPVKTIMSPLPWGFISYFETRFPRLLMHCVGVCSRFLERDKDFSVFCKVISPLYKNPPILDSLTPISSSKDSMTSQSLKSAPSNSTGQNGITDEGNSSNSNNNNNNSSSKSFQGENGPSGEMDDGSAGEGMGGGGIGEGTKAVIDSLTNDVEEGESEGGLGSDNHLNGREEPSRSSRYSEEDPSNNNNNMNKTPAKSVVIGDATSSCVDEQTNSASTQPSENTNDENSASTPPQPQSMAEVMQLLESGVTVWSGSALALTVGCIGWWRETDAWCVPSGPMTQQHGPRSRGRPSHLTRAAGDPKYRSRLCTHWELTGGTSCPMRKKGKCDFAHGPLELRVKEGRRGRWGHRHGGGSLSDTGDSLTVSGGEDVLGAARSIEKVRAAEGSVSDFEKSTTGARRNLSGASSKSMGTGGNSKKPFPAASPSSKK